MRKRSRSEAAKLGWRRRRRRERERERQRERRRERDRERRRREREREKRVDFEPPEPPVDDGAFEWEIGFAYRGGDTNSHVDVNIRVRRDDGGRMTLAEAQAVFHALRENTAPGENPIPDGYQLSAINWRRPRQRTDEWRGGDDDVRDLLEFSNPMYVDKDNEAAWTAPEPRFGSVKS